MKTAAIIILVAIVCGGCKRPADVQMENFAKTVRQTINPDDLQAWSAKMISNTTPDHFFVEYSDLSTNAAPKGLQELMTNYATVSVVPAGSLNDVVLVYVQGGGFGHWGFAVGAPTYTCSFGHTQAHWTNGIWFWTE
jgi:hypothetical protein